MKWLLIVMITGSGFGSVSQVGQFNGQYDCLNARGLIEAQFKVDGATVKGVCVQSGN
jgi:hypothetical protein